MADNKSKTDNRNRSKVAGEQDHEVQYLAKEAGITPEQAKQLIRAYGNDREKLMKAARGLAAPSRACDRRGCDAPWRQSPSRF